MEQVVQFRGLSRARRQRSERLSTQQCVELLELNLKRSLDRYFLSPNDERPMRATQIRKLSEILEYAVRLL
ncbi:MAG: hypothetical protein QF619_05935 [Candidatus Binatia bacterium]|jgi:hypothetical protein|nr:hypothetical protein [Candidatus Binatia bacterium]